MLKSIKLVYVFDASKSDGYEFRAPYFIARRIMNRSPKCLDYAFSKGAI